MMRFKTRYQAKKYIIQNIASGFKPRIINTYPDFIIECYGNKYIQKDGSLKEASK